MSLRSTGKCEKPHIRGFSLLAAYAVKLATYGVTHKPASFRWLFVITSTALALPAIQTGQTPVHNNRGLGLALAA